MTKKPYPPWWPENPFEADANAVIMHQWEGWEAASDEIWEAVQAELGTVENKEKLYGKKGG